MSENSSRPKKTTILEIIDNENMKLCGLKELGKSIAENFENQLKLREQLDLKNERLRQFSENLSKQLEVQLWENYECKKKLLEVNPSAISSKPSAAELQHFHGFECKNFCDQLNWMCDCIPGYSCSFDPGTSVATLHYNEDCFVKLKFHGTYDLLQIRPTHPFFDAIKKNLEKTRDIVGLLLNLRKFFKFVLELKTEKE